MSMKRSLLLRHLLPMTTEWMKWKRLTSELVNLTFSLQDKLINNESARPFENPLHLIPLQPPTGLVASVGFSL